VAAVEQLQVRPGNPVRAMLAQRLPGPAEILAKLGGQCAAEYKYDGVRVQAHRTADGAIELFTRRPERVSTQIPDVVEVLRAGLGPREAIVEGEVVAFDASAGELRPFGEVMFRRRKHGISDAVREVPVGLFCFELLYADGQDLTRLSYPQRRAKLAQAITVSPQLRLTTATEVAAVAMPADAVMSSPSGAPFEIRCTAQGMNCSVRAALGRMRSCHAAGRTPRAERGIPCRSRSRRQRRRGVRQRRPARRARRRRQLVHQGVERGAGRALTGRRCEDQDFGRSS
jgi:hypothetical protein